MKKIALTLAVFLLFNGIITAQQNETRPKRSNFTPEQMATLKSKKMALHLGLNEQQQKAIYQLEKKKVNSNLKTKKEFTANNGSRLNQNSEFRFNKLNSSIDNRISYKNEMQHILTKDQFLKWEKNYNRKVRQGNARIKNKMETKRSPNCYQKFNGKSQLDRG